MTEVESQIREFTHRTAEVRMRHISGAAVTYEVEVRWQGRTQYQYFTTVPAWKSEPNRAENLVKDRIDAALELAWIRITTRSTGRHYYKISKVTLDGDYVFVETYMDGRNLRYSPRTHRVEIEDEVNRTTWNSYIDEHEILDVEEWRSY